MKKIISVLTATRAEYGLLKPVIDHLNNMEEFDVRVVVTGAHLSPEFGLTYRDIENHGIHIDERIEILLSADTPSSISKSMGLAMISFADYFNRLKPDMLIVLGDRYETLSVALAAMNQRIPIAHLHGGEITEGAVDDAIRHAITKMSYLHFTSTEEYRRRVIQLGEQPDRVFCVGAIGIENIYCQELLTKSELEDSLQFVLDKPFALVTFHPVTLENNTSAEQFENLLKACTLYPELQFIFTKANADTDGRIINKMMDDFVKEHENTKVFSSLGSQRYLSALKYCSMVLGNSSSGLLEAPSFGIPTINIGNRQKGRIQADSVINCMPVVNEIKAAMDLALSNEFREKAGCTVNPYGDGNTASKIADVIKSFLEEPINIQKKFYDYIPDKE